MNCSWRVLLCAALAVVFACAQPVFSGERRRPLMIEGKKFLPLRVLVRPFSNVYKEKSETAGVAMENLPAFQSFYVYARPTAEDIDVGKGWYEVGSDNRGTVIGWMKATDVFEWKQTMCLVYTHSEGRKPVLMFEKRKDLFDLVRLPPEERIQKAIEYYGLIKAGNISKDFPIVSVEPRRAIDLAKEFYLLPILNFEPIEVEKREGRLLRLAAATASAPDARESTDIRKSDDYLKKAVKESLSAPKEIIEKLKVDLIWVMDTTVSMKPHIQKSLEIVRSVSKEIARDAKLAEAIRFGFWGYRDSEKDIPGIGYTTKNYTPKLEPVDKFIQTLAGVDVTKIDSVDWPEDVFSGVADAVTKSSWTPGALRILFLVGDAPAHPLGHPWNLSLLDEKTLREIAHKENTFIYSVFIKDHRATKLYETAETHFRTLSMNPGVGEGGTFYDIESSDLDGFGKVTRSLMASINKVISTAKKGKVEFTEGSESGDKPLKYKDATVPAQGGKQNEIPPETPPVKAGPKAKQSPSVKTEPISKETLASKAEPKPKELPPGKAALRNIRPEDKEWLSESGGQGKTESGEMLQYERMSYQMIRAALVQWVGSMTGTKAPRDIVAYVTDKDLVDPNIQSMDVCLLINKNQLASLSLVLRDILASGRKGQLSGVDFFEVLQATAATAAREPNQIRNAKSMAQTGIVPEFLAGLPYKSQLMDITNELWYSWSRDEQDEFLNSVDAKIKAYQSIHDSPDGWVALNQGDDPGEYVFPIKLSLLP